MQYLKPCLGFFLILLLSGCSSIISTFNKEGIQEDPTKRTWGTRMDDNRLETMIKVNLNAESEQLRRSHISVTVYNSVVLMVGQVATQDLKNQATRVATSSSTQVKTVHNELEVAGSSGFLSRTGDVWLASKIKTKLLAHSEISGLGTKVITENGAVYLMGLVTQEQARRIVEVVSNTGGVTKVVRAFEYVD